MTDFYMLFNLLAWPAWLFLLVWLAGRMSCYDEKNVSAYILCALPRSECLGIQ